MSKARINAEISDYLNSSASGQGASMVRLQDSQTVQDALAFLKVRAAVTVDPRDFGARMNGTTDDTLALTLMNTFIYGLGAAPITIDFGGGTMLASARIGGNTGIQAAPGADLTVRNGKFLVKGTDVSQYPAGGIYGYLLNSLTIEDFEFDYQDPPFFQAKCVAVNTVSTGVYDAQFDWAGYWNPPYDRAKSIYLRDTQTKLPIDVVTFGPGGDTGTYPIDTRSGTTLWVRGINNVQSPPVAGSLYTLSYRDFEGNFVLMEGGKDLTMRNVKVRAAAGAGLFARYVERITITDHDESPAAGSIRWQTTNVDALHFDMCSGRIDVFDSTFGWCGDDCFNVVGREYIPTNITGNTFGLDGTQTIGTTIESGLILTSPGDSVGFTNAAGQSLGNARIMSQTGAGTTTRTITVDSVPGGLDATCRITLFRYVPQVRVTNCRVGRNRGRGIVGAARDVQVRGSSFLGVFSTAVELGVSPYQNDFQEATLQATGIIIDDCTIEQCGVNRAYISSVVKVAAYKVDGSYADFPAASRVQITNNTFSDAPNSAIVVAGFVGAVVKGNSFWNVCTNPFTFTPNTASSVIATYSCDRLRVEGNTTLIGANSIGLFGTNGVNNLYGINLGMTNPS